MVVVHAWVGVVAVAQAMVGFPAAGVHEASDRMIGVHAQVVAETVAMPIGVARAVSFCKASGCTIGVPA